MELLDKNEPTTGLVLGDISNIGEVFKYLDRIAEPKLKREKTRAQRLHNSQTDRNLSIYADFVTQLNPFMCHINSLHDYTMATIFYTRMAQTKTILSESQMKRYKQLFILYLDLIDQVPEDVRQGMNETAVDLLHHLHTHSTDPDSAIVGLTPTDDVVVKVGARDAGDLVNHTREMLISEVLKWSNVQDAEEIKRCVRSLAASLRGVDKLKLGEVVIVKATNRTSFARISSERSHSGEIVRVFFDPMETTTVPVEVWRIYPLTRQILDSMRDVKQMEKLIKQNTEGFFTSLHQDVKMKIFNSLSGIGMDLSLIQRATDLQTSVLDLYELRKASAKLTDLADNPSGGIFKSSEDYMRSKVDEYIAQMDKKQMFMPRYDETMDQLCNYYKLPLARSRIRQLQGACDLAIDNLSLEMRKLLNGTRKGEITEWWLKLIETTVNDFLRQRKYEFSAVPDNYIERPPADVGLVRKNLKIVQCILDPAPPPNKSPKPLIAELQGKVYPIIDDFMKKALVALSEALSLPISQNLSELPEKLPGLLAAVEQLKPTIQPLLAEQLLDMVHDLEYLCEMKRLEYSHGEKSLHIVPVCGLVMGTFVRLENELKTVIELWDDTEVDMEPYVPTAASTQNVGDHSVAPANNSTGRDEEVGDHNPTHVEDNSASEVDDEGHSNSFTETKSFQQGQSPLHRAVCTDKLKSVLKILVDVEYARNLINVPNAKGWSPLHMASLLGNFDICDKLLEIEGVDVTSKTEDGTTPLHFLVRHPASDAQKAVLHKLFEFNPPVNIANRHGETPLHGASLKGNVAAVEMLISHGADLNAITIGGEAPIHYAVTGGAVPVVELLLEAGADPTLSAQRGTPLELAQGYKHEQIVQHLRASVGPLSDRGWPRTTRTPPGILYVPEATIGYDEAMRKQIRIGTRRRKSMRKSRNLHAETNDNDVITPFTPKHIVVALQKEVLTKLLTPASSPLISPINSPPQESLSSLTYITILIAQDSIPAKSFHAVDQSLPIGTSPSMLNESPLLATSPTNSPPSSPIQIQAAKSQTINNAASPSTDFMFPFSWRAARSPGNISRTTFLNRNLLRDPSTEIPERQARKLKSDSDNTGFARKHSSTAPTTLTSVSAPAHTVTLAQLNGDRPLPVPPKLQAASGESTTSSDMSTLAKQIPQTKNMFASVNRFAPVALLGMNDLNTVKLKPTAARMPRDRSERPVSPMVTLTPVSANRKTIYASNARHTSSPARTMPTNEIPSYPPPLSLPPDVMLDNKVYALPPPPPTNHDV